MLKKYTPEDVYMGRLQKGDDLLNELTKIVKEKDINSGMIKVIGAVQNAKIGYYDQNNYEYEYKEFHREMEIVSCIGNISILKEKPFIHAHIVLADEDGS